MGTLFSAPAPVRMMWEFSTWITLCPSRTRYAPMPIARHVTCTTQRRDENAARTRKKSKIKPGSAHHADGDNLLVRLRRLARDRPRSPEVLYAEPVLFPDDVGDDVPAAVNAVKAAGSSLSLTV